jgi:transcription-repair coupling factor (superfamily II helicase)
LNLAGLLPLISQIPGYARLLADLRAGRATTLTLLEAARPFVFAALQRDLGHPVLIVTDEPERARQLQAQIRLWSVQPGGVLLFPEPDALPYERVAWSAETISQRLAVLTTLSTPHASRIPHQHPIIIASARAIVQKTIPRQAFASASRPFRQGDRVDLTDTLALLYDLGYEPGSVVESPGTSSRRGGIIDVYPPATESPVRIEFFGNEIESIRPFDPLTQRSQGRLHTATITPGNEALLTRGPHAARELARLDVSTCHPLAQSDFRRAIEALEHSQPFHGRELFLQYLYTQPGMLLDYLPSDGVLILEEAGEIEAALREVEDHAALVRDDLVKGSELPEGFLTPHFGADRVWGQLSARPGLRLSYAPGSKHDDVGSAFLAAPHYGGQLQDALKESLAARRDGPVVMVTRQAQRLSELLAEDDVFIAPVEQVDALPVSGSLTLVQGALAEGWKIAFGSQQSAVSGSLLLLTDTEIFGWRMPQPRRARRRPAITTPEAFFSDLKVGDYVVHIDYGIGLFQGLIKLVIPGSEREYLQVDYAGEDRLYVPVHQTDRLSRYVGASDHPPFLSRLGTADWEHIKERTSAAVADIAQELLDLYAAREVVSGHAFSPDPP